MENTIRSICGTERRASLSEFLVLSKHAGVPVALWRKIRALALAVSDYIACPSFFEGELADSSNFNTRILLINKLNNK